MNPTTLPMLHVEDDPDQQKAIAHWVKRIDGFQFEIRVASGEEEAVKSFSAHPAELVILDYQLTEGNGLNCLRRLRQLDAFVPVIAVSGVADSNTFTELMQSGAADCLRKEDLKPETLANSIRSALEWAQAKRNPPIAAKTEEFESLLQYTQQLSATFLESLPASFFERLDKFENQARHLNVAQRRKLLKTLRKEFSSSAERLRPLQLELAARILESTETETDETS